MATRVQVTIDCADPDAQARFWAAAIGYIEPSPPDGAATWEEWLREHGLENTIGGASAIVDPEGVGPRFYFQKVPEGKSAKNRMHLDLNVPGGEGLPAEERAKLVDGEGERLIALGATKVEACTQHGEYWIVLQDPEGNEFCIQ